MEVERKVWGRGAAGPQLSYDVCNWTCPAFPKILMETQPPADRSSAYSSLFARRPRTNSIGKKKKHHLWALKGKLVGFPSAMSQWRMTAPNSPQCQFTLERRFHAGLRRKENMFQKLQQPDLTNKSGQLAVCYYMTVCFIGGWQIPLWFLWLVLPGWKGRDCEWAQPWVNYEMSTVSHGCVTGLRDEVDYSPYLAAKLL